MNLGAFAAGFGTGATTAASLVKEKRAGEEHALKMKQLGINVDRLEKEQPVIDKELQVRGAQADYNITEQDFKNSLQTFEHETKRLQAKTAQTTAQTQGAEATAALERQPDELSVKREALNDQVITSSLRQTANIYRVAKLGDVKAAMKMYNDSQVVDPGAKAKSMKFDEVEVSGQAGTEPTQKVKVLTIETEDGKTKQVPVDKLEALEQQFGATYQKVGNAIVRIGRDGKATPIYEATEVGANGETGDLYYKKGPKAGEVATPAAAGGLPRPGGKEATRIDDRVTKGRIVIDKYFGINEFTKLDEAAQPAYNAAVARMGALTRGGMDPEKAANQSVLEQKDGRLNPDGTPKAAAAPAPGAPASRPGGGYAGPTPWKK
jgi:hypothetical protein